MPVTKNGQIRTKAQVDHRLHSKLPGYHSKLPDVFPYFWKGAVNDVAQLVQGLTEDAEELAEGSLWFAVTGHPKAMQSEVTLWLSADAAQYLLGSGTIASVHQYERF